MNSVGDDEPWHGFGGLGRRPSALALNVSHSTNIGVEDARLEFLSCLWFVLVRRAEYGWARHCARRDDTEYMVKVERCDGEAKHL